MNIILHMPDTEEGLQELKSTAAKQQAKMIIDQINAKSLSKSQKEKLLDKVIKKLESV